MKTFRRLQCPAGHLIVILTLLLTWGCSSDQPRPPQSLSTLVIGTGRDATRPGDFQPVGMWEPACLIYETLVNLDTDARPVPCLAASWKVSEDGRTYIFDLRENAVFHDNTPFNAKAVTENFEKIGRTQWQVLGPLIRRVRTEGEYRVVFDLKRPSPLFLIHLAGSGHGMVSPSAIQAGPAMSGSPPKGKMPQKTVMTKQAGSWTVARPLGTGPYIWDDTSYERARTFAVTANPDYWQGAPRFERIVWEVIPDANARTLALETNEIHITGLTPNGTLGRENLDSLRHNPDMAFAKGGNWGARLMVINIHRPPFDRPGVRKAMKLALDMEEIQTFLGDTARVCTGPLGPDTPYTRPGLALSHHDPDRAMTLLDNEGIKDTDGNGIREFEGQPFSLSLITTKTRGLGVLVCERFKAVGIDARLTPREGGSVFEVIRQGDYDIISHPNIPSFYLDLYGAFHSGSWLSVHLNDPDLDRILEQARLCPDKETFLKLSWDIQDRILASDLILFGINESKNAAFRKELGDFTFPPEEWVGAAQDLWKMN